MRIALDKVILRRPEPKDVEQLYRYRNDYEVTRSLVGFSTGYSMQDLREWVDFHRNRKDEIIWTIAEKESDECIGHVGLYTIDPRVRSASFAILVGNKDWWGRGAGKAATCAVVDYGFRHLNLHRISLTVLKTNTRAIALYEKVGFKTEGVLRDDQFRDHRYVDVIAMGILEHEWEVL